MPLRAAFATVLAGLAAAGGDQGHAMTLTQANFDGYVAERKKSNTPCLIMFHVSWCKVCQKTFPHFAAASTKVLEAAKGMDFAHVDCEKDKPLCKKYSVKGYPSIKLFSPEAGDDEEPRNYKGLRTEENFMKYVDRMLKPPVQPVADEASLQSAAKDETYSAFVASQGVTTAKGLVAAAKNWMDRHRFLAAPGGLQGVLASSLSAPAGATLAVVSDGKQQWPGLANEANPAASFFTGSLDDEAAVSAWVEGNRFPGIMLLGETNFYEFTHAGKPAVIVALDPSKPAQEEEDSVRNAAAALSSEFLFGVINGTDFADELDSFGIGKGNLPAVLVTEDNFESWIEDREALRVTQLTADLKALKAGAPLLRQSRGSMSKLKYYLREAQRFVVKAQQYAQQGPKEVAIVAGGVIGALFVLWLVGKVLGFVFNILFTDDLPEAQSEFLRQQLHKESARRRAQAAGEKKGDGKQD